MEVSPGALVSLQLEKKSHTVLDTREAWKLDICALTDCLHIPLGKLAQRVDEVPKNRPIVVVCHRGCRSLMATQFLRGVGVVQAINLEGDVEAWATKVDRDMQRC